MNKRQILLDHLELGKTLISVNPSVEGVKLPSHLMNGFQCNLYLSYHFQMPMMITSEKVVASLTFQGQVFECHIPLRAIYCIRIAGGSDLDVVLFEEDVPEELFKMSNEILEQLPESALEKIHEQALARQFMEAIREEFERDDIGVSLRETEDEKPQ